MPIPKQSALFNPLIKALGELGGSASIQELENAVGKELQLSETDMGEIHRGNQTRLSYNLAWARTYLKQYCIFENSARGVLALTEKGNNTEAVNPSDVIAFVQQRLWGY
jgi:restriction system protein